MEKRTWFGRRIDDVLWLLNFLPTIIMYVILIAAVACGIIFPLFGHALLIAYLVAGTIVFGLTMYQSRENMCWLAVLFAVCQGFWPINLYNALSEILSSIFRH